MLLAIVLNFRGVERAEKQQTEAVRDAEAEDQKGRQIGHLLEPAVNSKLSTDAYQ